MLIGDLLQRFCADAGPLDKPRVKGGWRYFTDGRVLLRMPAPGCMDEINAGSLQRHPESAMEGFESATDWHPWPTTTACHHCAGNREIETTCSDCRGKGTCSHCGNGECPDCAGSGKDVEICKACVRPFETEFGDTLLSKHFVWLVGQLGGVEWAAAEPFRGGYGRPVSRVFFRCAEGQGVVAGLDPDLIGK